MNAKELLQIPIYVDPRKINEAEQLKKLAVDHQDFILRSIGIHPEYFKNSDQVQSGIAAAYQQKGK